MDWVTLATAAQVAMELVDSESEEEEFDDVVAMLAVRVPVPKMPFFMSSSIKPTEENPTVTVKRGACRHCLNQLQD
ncbi:hypothetical protein MTO96_040403 [Rhipicephalus appendiculatus]